MGGPCIYPFNLVVFYYKINFNLANLPYSVGFLGKGFILFQIIRDDFISLIVRGY